MQVETFECTETAEESVEASAEVLAIVEQLGLEGQSSLFKRDNSVPCQRAPYREMTAEEVNVYKELCPSEYALKDYKASPIPLRVLQVAAHASEFYKVLVVWDKTAEEIKDPVLIGQTTNYAWDTGFKRVILARWGETLEAFATLRRQACQRKRERLASDAATVVRNIEAATDDQILKSGRVEWS